MKNAIKNLFDKLEPAFTKGGKLEKFFPVYDGLHTFAFTPAETTHGGAHIRDGVDLKRTMITVVLALVPALLFGMWNVGFQHYRAIGADVTFWNEFLFGFLKVLPLVVVSYGVGLGVEFIFCIIHKTQIQEGYLVTGMLIPLIMPIDIPIWMLILSIVFAVVVGKEIFGGTGMNVFNPALVARAFAFFAYPAYMSGEVWISTSAKDTLVDGFSGATTLAEWAVSGASQYSVADMIIGTVPGSVGETSVIAIALGAALLIFTGIGSWKIMASAIAGGAVMGLIFNVVAPHAISPEQQAFMAVPYWQHLIAGGFAFGVVFMATDPVTAAQTETGKWIYGFFTGLMAIMIRVFNPAYPEGVMLAILFMNTMAPLIDHYVVRANINRRKKRLVLKEA